MTITTITREDLQELQELQALGYTRDPITGRDIERLFKEMNDPTTRIESFKKWAIRTGWQGIDEEK